MPRLSKYKRSDIEEAAIEVASKLSFDPFDVTEKIMILGNKLTNINLYRYQYDPVFRIIYSCLTLEGESVTLLTARQCVREGTIIHDRDGSLIPIEKHPRAWKTGEERDVYRIETDLGHFVEVTENHPIDTPIGWKNCEEINPGDRIACLVHWSKFQKKTSLITADLLNADTPLYEHINQMSLYDVKKFLHDLYFMRPDGTFSAKDYTDAQTLRETLNKLGFPCYIDRGLHGTYLVCFIMFGIKEVFHKWITMQGFKLDFNYDFIGEDGEYYAYARVKSKELIGQYPVWDIEVPEKHWFTCGGVKVHNSGKSESIAFTGTTLMVMMPALAKYIPELDQFKNGFKVGLFAPQREQVDNIYGRIKSRILSDNAAAIMADKDINTGIQRVSNLTLTNGSTCSAQVASKNSKIEGNTLDLVIIDESQDVDSLIATKSIEPMTSAVGGSILRTGTVGTKKSNFYEEINANKKSDRKVSDSRLKKHYEYDYKKVIQYKRDQYAIDGKRFHLNYEKDVLKKRDKWGEGSDTFSISYALRWKFESGMFVTEQILNTIIDKRLKLVGHREEDHFHYAFGIDWAKENANTVVTILKVFPNDDLKETKEEMAELRPKKQIVDWVEFEGDDYEVQHTDIMLLVLEYMPQYIFSDSTGVGNAPTDRLAYAVPEVVVVIHYVFSRPSKSDLWLELAAAIKNKELIVPGHKEVAIRPEFSNFCEQGIHLVKYYSGGFLVVHKSEGFKDDYWDSLGLAVLAANMDVEISENEIEVIDNPMLEGYQNRLDDINRNSW